MTTGVPGTTSQWSAFALGDLLQRQATTRARAPVETEAEAKPVKQPDNPRRAQQSHALVGPGRDRSSRWIESRTTPSRCCTASSRFESSLQKRAGPVTTESPSRSAERSRSPLQVSPAHKRLPTRLPKGASSATAGWSGLKPIHVAAHKNLRGEWLRRYRSPSTDFLYMPSF